jgi:hypothetical protein
MDDTVNTSKLNKNDDPVKYFLRIFTKANSLLEGRILCGKPH